MGARHHRELEVWQLANQIRETLLQITARADVRRDESFCDQTGRAANSACRNIAEGFYRSSRKEFAQFLNIARGSLGELLDSLDEARQKPYITDTELQTIDALVGRAMAATRSLRRYLISTREPTF